LHRSPPTSTCHALPSAPFDAIFAIGARRAWPSATASAGGPPPGTPGPSSGEPVSSSGSARLGGPGGSASSCSGSSILPCALGAHAPACLPARGDQPAQAIPTSSDGPSQTRGASRRLGGRRGREEATQDRGRSRLDGRRRRVLRGAPGGRAFPPSRSGRRSPRTTPGPCFAEFSDAGACRARSGSTTATPGA
jgi:hypothetical protein